jgi:hypothetical protein
MNYFRPTKYTGVLFVAYMCILGVTIALSFSSVHIPWFLSLMVIYTPLFLVSFLFSLLSIDIQLGYWGVPEPMGWFFIVIINIIVSYMVSSIISRLVTRKTV